MQVKFITKTKKNNRVGVFQPTLYIKLTLSPFLQYSTHITSIRIRIDIISKSHQSITINNSILLIIYLAIEFSIISGNIHSIPRIKYLIRSDIKLISNDEHNIEHVSRTFHIQIIVFPLNLNAVLL